MRSLYLTTYASRVFAKLKDFAQKVNSNSKTKQRSKNLVPHYISLKFASLKLIFTPKLMEDDKLRYCEALRYGEALGYYEAIRCGKTLRYLPRHRSFFWSF